MAEEEVGGTSTEETTTTTEETSETSGEDTAGLKSALTKERSERKAAERKAKDLETRLTTLENAGKSDEEKRTARSTELEKENASLTEKVKQVQTDQALSNAAIEAKARRPAEVVKLVDRSEIEYDADGNVRNAAEVVAHTKERVSELFTGGKPTGDGDGGPRGKTAGGKDASKDMDKLLRAAAGH